MSENPAAVNPAASDQHEEVHSSAASLFDLRNVISVLFGGYGLVLLIVGLTNTTDADLAKAGGIHLNTWTGAAMLVMAVVFVLWARLRPLRPPTQEELAEAQAAPPTH